MKVTILSDRTSWINQRIRPFLKALGDRNIFTRHVHGQAELERGDVCFILSFSQILKPDILNLHNNNIVVHESRLPQGKGWSPLTWQVIEGKNLIPISLLDASAEKVDSGLIYLEDEIHLAGHELVDELRDKQASATFDLCLRFLMDYPAVITRNGKQQVGVSSYYKRRGPADSQLDVTKSIASQFNLLRTVDNEKYPAFFIRDGIKYILKIEKQEST